MVRHRDVTYAREKGSLSLDTIPERCALGPRRNAKEPMKSTDPSVKDSANLPGNNTAVGKKNNARKKKQADATSSMAKPLNLSPYDMAACSSADAKDAFVGCR